MKFSLFAFVFLMVTTLQTSAQTLPSSRIIDWSRAHSSKHIPTNNIDITTLGAVGDGVTDCSLALQSAINSFGGNAGIVLIPAGTFLITNPIDIADSVIIRGVGANDSKLKFNGGGVNVNFLTASGGGLQAVSTSIISNYYKGSTSIGVASTTGLAVGDFIKIFEDDAGRMFSGWAANTIGQYNEITSITPTEIGLKDPLHTTYYAVNNPKVTLVNLAKGIGIECLYIERLDATPNQSSNILFIYATQCWVNGVQSYNTNFGHLVFDNSLKCEASDSHFKDAFAYGGNGQAYGVVCQMTTTLCRVENNIFDHLRHSMLIQAGSNGNVYGYNYSKNAFWASFPSNAAGDIALHGNYTYANLFEGNILQNIVIDNSHGINGPNNVIFRNRGQLYGIFMNGGAGDSSILVGNEITGVGFGLGQYTITGSGNFLYGNNKNGVILPSGTTTLPDTTYYLNKPQPPCWQGLSSIPTIGTPNVLNAGTIAALQRSVAGNLTICKSMCNQPFNEVITGDTLTCPGNTKTYTTAHKPCTTYTWSVVNGTIASGQGTNTINVLWNTAATETINVVAEQY